MRTFNSPPRNNYSDVLHDKLKDLAANGESENRLSYDISKDSKETKNGSKIFYANIGREPYIINRYVRPKGLSSFKLSELPTESELEFKKRKDLYMLERDLKCQYEILRT